MAAPNQPTPVPCPDDGAHLHEGSETVRFLVVTAAGAVDASISRQALRHRFAAGESSADLLPTYRAHKAQIHAAVTHRLQQGAYAPVMLREADFPRHGGGDH